MRTCWRQYQRRFRYNLVTSNQDTKVAQYLLAAASWRASPSNICCVGDDDQFDLRWRGAEVGTSCACEKGFPGCDGDAAGAELTPSRGISCARASGVIAANKGRLETHSHRARGTNGEKRSG